MKIVEAFPRKVEDIGKIEISVDDQTSKFVISTFPDARFHFRENISTNIGQVVQVSDDFCTAIVSTASTFPITISAFFPTNQ